ncbi:unnamed protein product [Paramecium primaurelia]|uniref:Transmembrane protein n=1 Tax=Paramecium primaurelia TaxID=5886 RepID=A0A8S1QJ11_PARPR|nr:unnamed protein product [Paramecium primaurelia]
MKNQSLKYSCKIFLVILILLQKTTIQQLLFYSNLQILKYKKPIPLFSSQDQIYRIELQNFPIILNQFEKLKLNQSVIEIIFNCFSKNVHKIMLFLEVVVQMKILSIILHLDLRNSCIQKYIQVNQIQSQKNLNKHYIHQLYCLKFLDKQLIKFQIMVVIFLEQRIIAVIEEVSYPKLGQPLAQIGRIIKLIFLFKHIITIYYQKIYLQILLSRCVAQNLKSINLTFYIQIQILNKLINIIQILSYPNQMQQALLEEAKQNYQLIYVLQEISRIQFKLQEKFGEQILILNSQIIPNFFTKEIEYDNQTKSNRFQNKSFDPLEIENIIY